MLEGAGQRGSGRRKGKRACHVPAAVAMRLPRPRPPRPPQSNPEVQAFMRDKGFGQDYGKLEVFYLEQVGGGRV